MENTVFNRTEQDSQGQIINPGIYNLIIGLVLCWGFFVNYLMVKFIPTESIAAVNPLIFFIGYFALCFAGIMIFTRSADPIISFLGYNLVVIPFGFIINIVVSRYDPAIVVNAMQVTAWVTLGMMILGSIFPNFFKKIHGALTIALIVVIIVELVEVFIFHMHHGIIDWIVVFIFCGYIGYDWGRANSIPKTVDNAVDSAAALYMDIINLFIRILRIMGRSRR